MRDGLQTVPTADSTSNQDTRDVVGNKTDDATSNSIAGRTHSVEEHMHSASMVHPTIGNGVAVATHADPWTLGEFVEIVAALAIGTQFDIHHVSIEALDDNTVYALVLYAVEVEIGRVRFTKNANLDAVFNVPMQTVIIAADTQIQAKCASAAGASSATISIFYHVYT